MTQLLTVLGTGKYNETCYCWEGKQVTTPYVAEALCEFFEPQALKVFVTAEAKAVHWQLLQERLGDRISPIAIDIPSGKSEDEIWQIFENVVNSVDENSQILFDITHAFRSIPMLVLLAAAFLQKAKNVEIKGVYYGAFEVNREQPPIFDLTPAVKLLDWLTATDKFINTGSSLELGELLSTIQQDFYRSGKQKDAEVKPTRLKSFGDRIQGISRSLELIRPIDLMTETAKLENIPITQLQDEVGTFAKPFELLLTQIQEDYGQFAIAKTATPKEELEKQFLLLRWYVAKKMCSQAILLSREWLISVLCVAEGIEDYRDRAQRKIIEEQLGQMIGSNPNLENSIIHHVNDAQALASFWSILTEYRNDLAHTQMRRGSISATKLQDFCEKELLQELTNLVPQFVV